MSNVKSSEKSVFKFILGEITNITIEVIIGLYQVMLSVASSRR